MYEFHKVFDKSKKDHVVHLCFYVTKRCCLRFPNLFCILIDESAVVSDNVLQDGMSLFGFSMVLWEFPLS